MQETFQQKLRRWRFNLLPSYRGSGGWMTHLADDWREVHVKLPLNIFTRNYVGTTFCGSMYAAIAPFYVAMIHFNLPKGHIVWDKSIQVDFKRPGKGTLYAKIILTQDDIDDILETLQTKRATERDFSIDLIDKSGTVCMTLTETIYIRRPPPIRRVKY